MSEAERLAKALEACDRSGMWYPSTEAAAELRRLSAELEALKKAISEAEPVVWANPNGGFLSDTYINQFATGLEKQTHTIPLYTLKGIK